MSTEADGDIGFVVRSELSQGMTVLLPKIFVQLMKNKNCRHE